MTGDNTSTRDGVERIDGDRVTELRLDRPDARNALDTRLLTRLRDDLEAIHECSDIGAVVFSGAGTMFCAGADIREFAAASSPDASVARLDLIAGVIRAITELKQLTIAVVHGAAIGAGWGLALGCDMCYAVQGTRFSLPELRRGYGFPSIIPARLARLIGPLRAMEIVLGGATVDAARGLTAGWVNEVFDSQEAAQARARESATAAAAASPRSVTAAVSAIRHGPEAFLSDHMFRQES